MLSNLKKRIELKQNYYIYINSTTNNTIMSLVNDEGKVLGWRSCGINFPGKQKSTEVANLELGGDMLNLVNTLGIKRLFFLLKGSASWHNSILDLFFLKKKFKIIGIKDVTGIPFNGCRKWKHRLKNKKRRRMFNGS